MIELLVGRSPSSLASLRVAFARERPPPPSAGPSTTSVGGPNSSASPSKPAAAARVPASPSSGKKQQQLQKPRSLDVAILSAYSANTRVRKAWEIALKGQWADLPVLTEAAAAGDEDGLGEQQRRSERSDGDGYRNKLLQEDLDQLKVALRRGGSTETT